VNVGKWVQRLGSSLRDCALSEGKQQHEDAEGDEHASGGDEGPLGPMGPAAGRAERRCGECARLAKKHDPQRGRAPPGPGARGARLSSVPFSMRPDTTGLSSLS
jgi:hypothetical protein